MSEGKNFESQVRQVAIARWNLKPAPGGNEIINGQEIDVVGPTDDLTHLVMCTISKKLDIVIDDATKLAKARQYLQDNEGTIAACWIVTREVPEPPQVIHGKKWAIKVVHFDEFRRTLVDAPQYFRLRMNNRFGSARDPFHEDSDFLPDDEYIEPTFSEHLGRKSYGIDKVSRMLEEGKVVVLLADFGFGKSLTVRELFFRLRDRYCNRDTAGRTPIPIPINLPEHGQATHYTEVLRDHARSIAYSDENHLIRIWNSGMAAILLDGFDELPAVQLRDESPKSRADARRVATKLIRDFIDSSRSRGGVLIAGRGQYFDSIKEMKQCFSLRDDDMILEIDQFSDRQLEEYLRRKEVEWKPPAWLPRNPLLIGYLVAKGFATQVEDVSTISDPVLGWPHLLNRICDRESLRTQGMFDGEQIAKLLRRLASRSRVRSGGALNAHEINETYRDVFDEVPIGNEYAVALLQRLPGLTHVTKTDASTNVEDGLRTFLDTSMANALRGIDLLRYVSNPYDPFLPDRHAESKGRSVKVSLPLERFGCEVAAVESIREEYKQSQLLAAARRANGHHNDPTLAADIIIAGGIREDAAVFDCEGLTLTNSECDCLDWDELTLNNITFNNVIVHDIYLPKKAPNGVIMENCYLLNVRGATNVEGLPTWIKAEVIESFDPTGNSSSLMQLDAALTVRVGLTILQKVFKQRGSGRKQNAFSRGIEPTAVKHVPAVLDVLESEGLLYAIGGKADPVWHGNPAQRKRAESILATAGRGDDPIIILLETVR